LKKKKKQKKKPEEKREAKAEEVRMALEYGGRNFAGGHFLEEATWKKHARGSEGGTHSGGER